LAQRFASRCTVLRYGSPELVALAEAKLAGEPVSVDQVRDAALPLFEQDRGEDIDTVVLACTHFPLLEEELRQAFPGLSWVDGGTGIARRIAYLTREQPWPVKYPGGIAVFTGGPPRHTLLGPLAEFGLGDVRSL
jgi:glutamate racemase